MSTIHRTNSPGFTPQGPSAAGQAGDRDHAYLRSAPRLDRFEENLKGRFQQMVLTIIPPP